MGSIRSSRSCYVCYIFALFSASVLIGATIDVWYVGLFSETERRIEHLRIKVSTPAIVPREIAEGLQACQSRNIVPSRGDTWGNEEIQSEENRPFSLSEDELLSFERQRYQHSRGEMRECSTVEEMLRAIAWGQRKWAEPNTNALSWVEREKLPSKFIPFGCKIPTLRSDDLCDISNQFSNVYFIGDSLTRHLQGGLWINLSNDLKSGMMINGTQEFTVKKCQCDGQFSEASVCRKLSKLYDYIEPTPTISKHGICPNLWNEDSFKQRFVYSRHAPWTIDLNCEDPDHKGVLFVMQGGLHQLMDAENFYRHGFLPYLRRKKIQKCAALGKLYVIWQSHGSQSPLMDVKYSRQNATGTNRFNEKMKEILETNRLETAAVLNWMNYTKGAQTSDGVHFLMNVNYFKAQYILQIANLMKKENMVSYANYTSLEAINALPEDDLPSSEDSEEDDDDSSSTSSSSSSSDER